MVTLRTSGTVNIDDRTASARLSLPKPPHSSRVVLVPLTLDIAAPPASLTATLVDAGGGLRAISVHEPRSGAKLGSTALFVMPDGNVLHEQTLEKFRFSINAAKDGEELVIERAPLTISEPIKSAGKATSQILVMVILPAKQTSTGKSATQIAENAPLSEWATTSTPKAPAKGGPQVMAGILAESVDVGGFFVIVDQFTLTPEATGAPTGTAAGSPTATLPRTPTNTPRSTPTRTPTRTSTARPTNSPTRPVVWTPTRAPIATLTSPPTRTPTNISTPTNTPTPPHTPTYTPTPGPFCGDGITNGTEFRDFPVCIPQERQCSSDAHCTIHGYPTIQGRCVMKNSYCADDGKTLGLSVADCLDNQTAGPLLPQNPGRCVYDKLPLCEMSKPGDHSQCLRYGQGTVCQNRDFDGDGTNSLCQRECSLTISGVTHTHEFVEEVLRTRGFDPRRWGITPADRIEAKFDISCPVVPDSASLPPRYSDYPNNLEEVFSVRDDNGIDVSLDDRLSGRILPTTIAPQATAPQITRYRVPLPRVNERAFPPYPDIRSIKLWPDPLRDQLISQLARKGQARFSVLTSDGREVAARTFAVNPCVYVKGYDGNTPDDSGNTPIRGKFNLTAARGYETLSTSPDRWKVMPAHHLMGRAIDNIVDGTELIDPFKFFRTRFRHFVSLAPARHYSSAHAALQDENIAPSCPPSYTYLYDDKLNDLGVAGMKPSGMTRRGEKQILLSPTLAKPDTLVHELGHAMFRQFDESSFATGNNNQSGYNCQASGIFNFFNPPVYSPWGTDGLRGCAPLTSPPARYISSTKGLMNYPPNKLAHFNLWNCIYGTRFIEGGMSITPDTYPDLLKMNCITPWTRLDLECLDLGEHCESGTHDLECGTCKEYRCVAVPEDELYSRWLPASRSYEYGKCRNGKRVPEPAWDCIWDVDCTIYQSNMQCKDNRCQQR